MPFNSPANIAQLIELLQHIDEGDSVYAISAWTVDAQFEAIRGDVDPTPYRIDVRLSFGWVGNKKIKANEARALDERASKET